MGHVDIVFFHGIAFRRYPASPRFNDRSYYRPSKEIAKQGIGRLHQEVWKSAHGPIPDGYQVHHIDGNVLNNTIDNLELLTAAEHTLHHLAERDPRFWEQHRDRFSRIRELGAEFARSDVGRAASSQRFKHTWEHFRQHPVAHTCEGCGVGFETTTRRDNVRFCSSRCAQAWRRASGELDVERTCLFCGNIFIIDRTKPAQTCSRLCGQRLRRRNERGLGSDGG